MKQGSLVRRIWFSKLDGQDQLIIFYVTFLVQKHLLLTTNINTSQHSNCIVYLSVSAKY
jgi:hypothetical protein